MELLSHKKTKEQIGLVFFIKPKAKNVKWEKGDAVAKHGVILERERLTSL